MLDFEMIKKSMDERKNLPMNELLNIALAQLENQLGWRNELYPNRIEYPNGWTTSDCINKAIDLVPIFDNVYEIKLSLKTTIYRMFSIAYID